MLCLWEIECSVACLHPFLSAGGSIGAEHTDVLDLLSGTRNEYPAYVLLSAGGSIGAERTYALELQSGSEGPTAFFNHLLVQPNFSVVVLANTKRKQVGG